MGKRRKSRILIILLTFVLCFGSYRGISRATDIDGARAEKSELEKKKDRMKEKIAELEKEKGNIITYIEKLDKQLNELADEIERLESEITDVQGQIEVTREELAAAKETESNQYVTMKKRIKYMYENGGDSYLEVLFSAKDISDLLNRAEYVAKISEYDSNLLERYKQTKEMVALKEKELTGKLADLESLNEQTAYEKETVEQLAEDKKDELARYEANISESQETVSEYDSEIERQEQLIEDLLEQERLRIEEEKRKEEERKRQEEERRKQEEEKKNQENGQEGNQDGQEPEEDPYQNVPTDFRWPLPVSGRITSYFGGRESPTAGASSYHKGVDIGVPTGTSVLAAAGGTVVTSSYQAAAGNYIMIYHGNSTYTVYMHCSKLLAKVGDEVKRGDVIAYSGSTGISTGPHLHFGVSINGTYVNPLDYVSN